MSLIIVLVMGNIQIANKSYPSYSFTLIELLVAMIVLVILAVFVSQALTEILRSRSKAEITRLVRQEGEYARSVMERHLRGAISATCVSSSVVTYTSLDGTGAGFSCVTDTTNNTYIASGSASTVRLTSPLVQVSNCQFTCPNPARVNFSFNVAPSQASTDILNFATFSTSGQVTLRNY